MDLLLDRGGRFPYGRGSVVRARARTLGLACFAIYRLGLVSEVFCPLWPRFSSLPGVGPIAPVVQIQPIRRHPIGLRLKPLFRLKDQLLFLV